MWLLRSNKTLLSERSSYFLSRQDKLLFRHFLFSFTYFIVLCDCRLCCYYCCYYYSCPWHFFIVNAFVIYCSSFCLSALYLCIKQLFLILKHMTRLNIIQSLQQRHWDCISDPLLVSLMGTLNNFYRFIYSIDGLLLKEYYYILLLTISSFII